MRASTLSQVPSSPYRPVRSLILILAHHCTVQERDFGGAGFPAHLSRQYALWLESCDNFHRRFVAPQNLRSSSLAHMRALFLTPTRLDITPFAGAFTVGLATALSGVSLIPLSRTSPIARIYLAGYASVVYSVFLNAFYAWKQEKRRRASVWQTPRAKL